MTMHRLSPLLLLIGACNAPATELVVLVDTDLAVNEELSSVRVSLRDGSDAETSGRFFTLADDGAAPAANEQAIPLSFAIVPKDGDASRRVIVQVDGLASDGTLLVRRRAATGFVEGEARLLAMFLARACRDTTCAAGDTCTENGCAAEGVDPQALPEVRPGEELAFDAGVQPSVDAGSDASLCDERVSCGGACTCATSCCEIACTSSPCSPTCNASTCHVVSAAGTDLDVECQMRTSCTVDAPEAASVTVDCMRASCDVDCRGAESCVVRCALDATCVVSCEGAGSCVIEGCRDAVMPCGGEVIACGTSCP